METINQFFGIDLKYFYYSVFWVLLAALYLLINTCKEIRQFVTKSGGIKQHVVFWVLRFSILRIRLTDYWGGGLMKTQLS